MQRGFANLYLLAGILILAALGCSYYFNRLAVKEAPGACTEEARQCPDGSYAGRTGPNCEFKPCPTNPVSAQTSNTATPSPKAGNTDSCETDSDCGINTCSCTAARKDSLGQNICQVLCVGEPKCINNKCELVENSVQDTYCGGFTGKLCPEGYKCQLDGNYPDAGGKCIRE